MLSSWNFIKNLFEKYVFNYLKDKFFTENNGWVIILSTDNYNTYIYLKKQ